MLQKYVVVDLETTGMLNDKNSKIIQFSAVMIENFQIVDQYTTFINPGSPIPSFIEELTGIKDSMVQDAPYFSEIAETIYDLMKDSTFVAHNVLFDLSFLKKEMEKVGFYDIFSETIDTVELAKILMPSLTSYKLTELSDYLEFTHDQPHRADSDALVTAELFLTLVKKIKELPLVTLEKLTDLAFNLKSDIVSLFQEILMEKQKKFESLPEHIEIFRGIAIRKKEIPWLENSNPKRANYPKGNNEKEQLFLESGLGVRTNQFEMMDTIYQAFNESKHAVIEAPTGIGKTIAYLLPSAYFSIQNDIPIIISTYTNQMQEQIFHNDLKKVERILSTPIKATVVKGRKHYINLLKFEQSLYEEDTNYDSLLAKMQILVWLITTETGDLDEVNFSGGGHFFKKRIQHDGWFINKKKDPWVEHDFYLHAKSLARYANIIITNHMVLLTDMDESLSLLPDYHHVIIDEAHHLERAARTCFGNRLVYQGIKYWLGRLGTTEKDFLFQKLDWMVKQKGLFSTYSTSQMNKAIIELDDDINDLFTQLSEYLIQSNDSTQGKIPKVQRRITENMKNERKWQSIELCAERVYDHILFISRGISERITLLKERVNQLHDREQAFLEEVNSFLKKWQAIENNLQNFFLNENHENILWLEGDRRSLPNTLVIRQEPKNVQAKFNTNLFSAKKSVILTSATLTIRQSFQYFLQQIGMEKEEIIQKIIHPHFDYEQMAKLIIPTDLPEIKGKKFTDDYLEAIASHIIAIAQATKGRMLILFTSYDMLTNTYYLLKESGSLDDYILLGQGVTSGSRSRLIKNFKAYPKSILLGTNSFWEGIDIPGESLSCLIIVRLPFSAPEEPVTEARYEELKKKGMNPFTAAALPEAIIRFKQGVGRLIRNESDRGVIIVFDRRLDTTTYGKAFLESIPKLPILRGTLSDIIKEIETWL